MCRRKFVWVNVQTRTLHWYKNKFKLFNMLKYILNRISYSIMGSNALKSMKDSKYLLLKFSQTTLPKEIGTLKGVVYSLKFHTGGPFSPSLIIIITENGERIELKVTSSANCYYF